MTRVLVTMGLLEYRQSMKETLHEALESHRTGSRSAVRVAPALSQANLLPPPCILVISLDAYQGRGDDCIGIMTGHDFELQDVRVTILDERGNLIESGRAQPHPVDPELWEFFPTAIVPSGTPVTVRVTAVDGMGGTSTRCIGKTLARE